MKREGIVLSLRFQVQLETKALLLDAMVVDDATDSAHIGICVQFVRSSLYAASQ
jgi:hypothetical protein